MEKFMKTSMKEIVVGLSAAIILCLAASCGGGGGKDAGSDLETEADADTAEDQAETADPVPDETAAEDPAPPDVAEEESAQDLPAEDIEDEDGDGPPPPPLGTCWDEPPPGAEMPDPLPVYAGECPTLVAGANTIQSGGATRAFQFAVPAGLDPAEKLPVLFLWHWLGGDGADFMEKGEVQPAVDAERFLAVAPEAKGDLLMKWPFLILDTAARMEEEARFFDDVLACVAEQFNVNPSCVSSVGVSSGALWTSQLAQLRSRRLASFLSLSGGVGVPGDIFNPVHPWSGADHVMPAMVLWGGPTDFCGLSFATTSGYLEAGLVAGGHFFVECIHNCSHAQPPMVPPPGESAFTALWTFVFDHPYWLPDGQSPYLVDGFPEAMPEWCGIGPGSATIRTGECESGLLGECL
jgi:hypothetical protein